MRRIATVIAAVAVSGCDDPHLPTDAAVPIEAPASLGLNTSTVVLTIREDLGTLGGSISSASDINNSNAVTGYSTTASAGSRAFLWTPQTGMVDVNAGTDPVARFGNAVNDAGQIAAYGSASATNGAAALRASPPFPSTPLYLGKLNGIDSFAWGINNSGTVVGSSEDPSLRPFIWVAPGPMRSLGSLGGGFGEAYDINDAGTVVGYSSRANGKIRAFRWPTKVGIVDLGTLGGDESAALGINSAGTIVGWANTASGARHAARWAPGGGGPVDLGTFFGGTSSSAAAINDVGGIAGSSTNSNGDLVGALWLSTGLIKVLRPLAGATSSAAYGINDLGHAAGVSDVPGGGQHAVVWWNYRMVNVDVCICRRIPSPYPGFMAIRLYGSRKLDVEQLELRLFTLGNGEGEDVPTYQSEGSPVYGIGDANDDGYTDLDLYFDEAALKRGGELTRTNQLTLLGTVRDRSRGVIGRIPLRRPD